MNNQGRIAGLLYLLASIPGFFALMYVPSRLIVHGNATATANNIAAHETLFRLGIAADLAGQAMFMFVALALYHLLKGVNQRHALLMLTLILVAVPIAFLNEVNSIAALVMARGADFVSVLDKPQRDALVRFFLFLRGSGFDSRRNLLGSMAVSPWDAGLSVRLPSAFLGSVADARHSCLPDQQFHSVGNPPV